MKAIEFPQQTVVLAKNQPQYTPLPIHVNESEYVEATAIFELSDEEIEVIRKTKKIFFTQCTLGSGFKPISITVYKQDSHIPMIGQDWYDLMIEEYQVQFLTDCAKRWNETTQGIRNTVLKGEFPSFKDFILDGLGIHQLDKVNDSDWSRNARSWDNISNLKFHKI